MRWSLVAVQQMSHGGRIVPHASEPLTLSQETTPAGGRRIPYVCMPGSPYTGSTLLGALLNEHPDCASIGAATGLIRRVDLTTYRCSCGKLFTECEFWHDVAARTKALGHPVDVFKTNFWNTHPRVTQHARLNAMLMRSLGWNPLNDVRDALIGRFTQGKVSQAAWNTWSLAYAILEKTGKSVFIDTARDHQRPKYLATHPLLDVKVIHLIRDPRGNSASIMKHTGVDSASAARQWRRYNVEAARVKRYLPVESWLTLRYEDLCADPGAMLDRVSDFLGIVRAPIQPVVHTADQHLIGNAMRLKGGGAIREDRSWQTRLSSADLAVIERIAGPTSRRLGFTWT